ncbi:LysE family translocator [Jannaschia sp. CCS1]|uniref:LysE family translocator n=1 Tax=Jannaschia sp. (strain CCS1) TaxID=290400 RepID=UPI000053ABF5|nr:LysE family translocator [Jannaschia sp. CCS1]ABD53774.1 Lysine exporter protein (LYSE/YGGA) [Jannaschia sp. CCS1]
MSLLPHLPALFAALGLFLLGFLVIGPNIAAIMATSMHRGRANGLRLATGIGLGTGIWASLTVAGLASLLTAYAGAVLVLKLFGAAFLLWLAVKAFRSALRADAVPPVARNISSRNLFLTGLTIQLTNPKAALQWIAIAAVAVNGDAPWSIGALLIVGATLLSVICHGAYALTFSAAPIVAGYARARRWIDGTLGLFFTAAAFKLATTPITGRS